MIKIPKIFPFHMFHESLTLSILDCCRNDNRATSKEVVLSTVFGKKTIVLLSKKKFRYPRYMVLGRYFIVLLQTPPLEFRFYRGIYMVNFMIETLLRAYCVFYIYGPLNGLSSSVQSLAKPSEGTTGRWTFFQWGPVLGETRALRSKAFAPQSSSVWPSNKAHL